MYNKGMYLSQDERDQEELHVLKKWVRKQVCSYAPLFIYTYSTDTELKEHWDKYTLMSRGLVLDDKNRIVIKCVPKFFNKGQKFAEDVELNDPETEITMKNDGYLIQIKKDSEYGLIVTSKGSFSSPMCLKAKELIREEELATDYTYICELCCNFPGDEAIIVKRWEGKPKLVVWAVMNPNNEEVDLDSVKIPECLEKVVRFNAYEASQYLDRKDIEGVVGKNHGKRVKFKTEHFMMMHRLISDVRKMRVWELLSKGLDLDSVNIPDEFMPTMKEWRRQLLAQKAVYQSEAEKIAEEYKNEDDKTVAMSNISSFYKPMVFNIRKGKADKNDEYIWKKIRETLKEENNGN